MGFIARHQRAIALVIAAAAGIVALLGHSEVAMGMLGLAGALGVPRASEVAQASQLTAAEAMRLRSLIARRDWRALAGGVEPETVTAVERALSIVRDPSGPDEGGGDR